MDDAATSSLLQDLTPAQRAAVVSPAAPLCILAAAGAGKTRVLTRRIAYRCLTGDAEAARCLALTFTRKAARELQDRLAGLGLPDRVAAGTFHGMAAAALRVWWADRGQGPPAIIDQKSRILADVVAERRGLAETPLGEIAGLIEWGQARAFSPDQFEGRLVAGERDLPPGLSPGVAAAVFSRYQHEKRRRGVMDFDDLLSRCAEALETDPTFAAASRWRWRHFFVDEFQDLNPLQHRLLLAWLGTSSDLCVVGDPNQAIYGWNGADPSLLGDLAVRWPSTSTVHLDENHRCSEQIVAAAAAVLGKAGRRLRGAGRQGPAPTVSSHPSDLEEAAAIARAVVAAGRAGRRWESMAVMTRTNGQLDAVAEALAALGVRSARTSRETLEAPGTKGAPAVTLTTFHRAKGLEWDEVWVAGVEEGLVPFGPGRDPVRVAEERRLLYVALTRAVDSLHVSWAARRSFGGRAVPRDPSRWLAAVAGASGGEDAGPEGAASRLSVARASLDSHRRFRPPSTWPAPDESVRRALRAWRSEVARSTGVQPHYLLHDATVEALAALRPRSATDLLAVPGVGPVKARRYGTDLLDIVSRLAETA